MQLLYSSSIAIYNLVTSFFTNSFIHYVIFHLISILHFILLFYILHKILILFRILTYHSCFLILIFLFLFFSIEQIDPKRVFGVLWFHIFIYTVIVILTSLGLNRDWRLSKRQKQSAMSRNVLVQ